MVTSEHAGDRHNLAWGYYYLGSARFQRNDGSGSERALRRCLALFEELADEYGQARAMCSFGAVVLDIYHDFDQARHWYDRAIPMMRRFADRNRLAIALGNLGEICRSEGNITAALKNAREALSIFQEIGEHTNAGWMLTDIAHYHAMRREFDRSLESLKGAFAELSHERVARWLAWYFDIAFIVAFRLERWEIAAPLLGFTQSFRDENNAPRMQALLPWLSEPIEELSRRMHRDDHLDGLRVAGEASTLEETQALIEQLATAVP